jgi:hypothetical protein
MRLILLFYFALQNKTHFDFCIKKQNQKAIPMETFIFYTRIRTKRIWFLFNKSICALFILLL